jgi:hypothetical protein
MLAHSIVTQLSEPELKALNEHRVLGKERDTRQGRRGEHRATIVLCIGMNLLAFSTRLPRAHDHVQTYQYAQTRVICAADGSGTWSFKNAASWSWKNWHTGLGVPQAATNSGKNQAHRPIPPRLNSVIDLTCTTSVTESTWPDNSRMHVACVGCSKIKITEKCILTDENLVSESTSPGLTCS